MGRAAAAPEHSCDSSRSPCAQRRRCIQLRWLAGATTFGTLFPLVGWLLALSRNGVESVAAAHRAQPVLFIIDLAPFVLGLTGFAIGHFHARIIKIRHSIEQTVQIRTAELERALANLSATQAEKDRFVASVSHELRTPMTSVVGLAHTLAESRQDFSQQEQQELLELIVSESEEVATIVEDLLVAARVESGELTLTAVPLRLDKELHAMVEVCEVEVQPVRVEAVTVIGDSTRIHQIVRNLITNADRYGGTNIGVEVYADNNRAILAVNDDGDGVPDDKLDCIFAPFGKAHNDPGRAESVGLGLTVSRNLARLMGGDVVYRRTNGWTSFELHLPLAGQLPGNAETPSQTWNNPASQGTTDREQVAYVSTS